MTNDPPPGKSSEFADFFHTDELPTGPLPRHSHRRERQRKLFESRLLAPLTAVAVVVVVILLLIWINGKPAGNGPGPGVISAPRSTTSARVTPAASKRPQHSAASTPTSRTTPSVRPTATRSAPATVVATATPRAVDRTAMAAVQVLNNSTISGLAARAASELRARHWKIVAVGNLQGVVPVTTVYYSSGQRAAAKHLAREFSSIRRVAPIGSTKLPGHGHRLTLVVTRDWSG